MKAVDTGFRVVALLCPAKSTQLVFTKCLLFAADPGVDNVYGNIPLPSLGFAWPLEFVLGG